MKLHTTPSRHDRWQWAGIGLSLVLITFLIYYSELRQFPFFATLRYLYVIPITYVALNYGRRYGVALSLLVTSLFLPILVTVLMSEGLLVTRTVELILTLILFNVLALFGGDLADREVLQKERYRALNQLSEQFSHELKVSELANVILQATAHALQAESGELWLCDNGDVAACKSIAHIGNIPTPDLHTPDISIAIPLITWILQHNTPLRAEYPDVDPRFVVAATTPPLHDVLAAPLRRAGKPYGAIILYNRQLRTFMQRDADLLDEIAIKSELALENALLYQTLESRVQQRTRDLAKEKNKLDVVLQSIADGLAVLDQDQRILMVNSVVANFLDRDSKSLTGQWAWDVFPSQALQAVVTQALEERKTISGADVVLPNGIILRTSVGLLRSSTDNVTGVVLVMRNVTHELEMDRMKTDFITMVTHELRTPLTGVLGFAKLIQKQLGRFPAEELAPGNAKWARAARRIKDNLTVITTEGNRLTHLIADVFGITRLEAGRIEWDRDVTKLSNILTQAVATLQDPARSKGLHVESDFAENLPLIYADHQRIMQVMDNLLSNALKFTDTGEIRVRAWCLSPGEDIASLYPRAANVETGLPATQPMVVVSVQDTGVGIVTTELPLVFKKFRQVGDRINGTRRQGTGLGLAICAEIITHHGGHIWVESQAGEGSRFIFTLPAYEKSEFEVKQT